MSAKTRRRLVSATMCAVLSTAWMLHSLPAAAHGIEPQTATIGSISDCLHHDQKKERMTCYAALCPSAYDCAGSLVTAATEESGAEAGMRVIADIADAEAYASAGFTHELAHVAGRTLAKAHGSTGDVFLTCPEEFQYGCVHGFFEEALLQAEDISATARAICASVTDEPLDRNRFFCAHGIGHGVMMARSNHVGRSLFLCDDMYPEGSDGCYQGVFHENIKAHGRKEARRGAFRSYDPLFPCTAVREQYQWGCFSRHASYLMRLERLRWNAATDHCLLAPPAMIPVCLSEFGQLAVDARWHPAIMEANPSFATDAFIESAVLLCDAVDEPYIRWCYSGAVDHLLNRKRFDDAVRFCGEARPDLRASCAGYIGRQMQERGTDDADALCTSMPEDMQQACGNGSWETSPPTTGDLSPVSRLRRSFGLLAQRVRAVIPALLSRDSTDAYAIRDVRAPREPDVDTTPSATIVFDGSAFHPNEINILRGEAVRWKNESDSAFWPASDVHPTHEAYSAFDAQLPQPPGSDYQFVFDRSGDWTFHDHLHPEAIGIVHVR